MSDTSDHLDLMRDEFMRIRVCPAADAEIKGLCDRAISGIERIEPLTVEADRLRRDLSAARAELEEMTREAINLRSVVDAEPALRAQYKSVFEERDQCRSELAIAREHESAALSGQRQLLAKYDGALRQLEEVRKGLRAVEELIDQSSGVYGLHMNGDLAPWSELRTGGRFEGWMADLDRAINAIPCASKAAGMDATAGEVKA